MSLTNFFQLLISGIAMGAIYTLTAKGLFIAHLATHRLNFGQGDFMMVAAFLVMAFDQRQQNWPVPSAKVAGGPSRREGVARP